MAIANKIEYAKLDDLYLDPHNPRLGRENTGPSVKQSAILDLMKDWALEELAVSFLEGGFWVQEALLVVREPIYGSNKLVVIEGNRRLAALKLLRDAIIGNPLSSKWKELQVGVKAPKDLFEKIPYILVDTRKDVDAFLGFRHVTGIKEWRPAEKAQYISKLIDERKMTYEEVMRKIGSKTEAVRRNYIAYRLLLQMEEEEKISLEHVEEKFSVLFLSLRTSGAQQYLHIDIKADPKTVRKPIPAKHMQNLVNFALWLFGDDKRPPLFTDSRYVDKFGSVLESPKAVEYLERTDNPNFDTAYRMAEGDETELTKLILNAADNIEITLSRIHFNKDSSKVKSAVQRLRTDVQQLMNSFPGIDQKK